MTLPEITPANRMEHDSMGELAVPADAWYGAQTQRAVNNFPLSSLKLPTRFIQALGYIKKAAALTNHDLGLLGQAQCDAIVAAADIVIAGQHPEQFPLDVFQTGSGTSTNMNVNEVIAYLAQRQSTLPIHPNDHVNLGQSSNDVIPAAIHLSACIALQQQLLPGLLHLASTLEQRAAQLDSVVKTGRTHLMDAMPIRFGQELGAWAQQLRHGIDRLESVMPRLRQLALGGTAVGTGINAHPTFGRKVASQLALLTAIPFTPADNYFVALSCQDTMVELSGQCRTVATSLLKICNDLRWMNSGPLTGLSEIELPALQPGSSIMPGKVNPVIPEAVAMVCMHAIGQDATIALAGQSGNFQLNVSLPIIAYNSLQMLELMGNAARLLADKAIAGFQVKTEHIQQQLAQNPILVTALNPVLGYEKGAAIAKQAYAEGRSVLEVAQEHCDLPVATLQRLLDPAQLTQGGIVAE